MISTFIPDNFCLLFAPFWTGTGMGTGVGPDDDDDDDVYLKIRMTSLFL
jgi:hypothetical protein